MIKNLIIAILCIFVIILFTRSCNKDKTDWKAKYEYANQQFDSIRRQQKVIVTEDKKLLNEVVGKKKSQAYFKASQVITIHDTIPVPFEKIRDTCTYVNRTFRNDSIVGTVTNAGVTIDTMKLKNDIVFKVFEKKRSVIVEATNSNPKFTISGMNSIMLKKKQPSRFGIGPYIGYDVLNKQASIGISLQFQLIRL
ncbi:MAG: hypothetical protein LC112_13825 [Flavobacteriales bacterium]|nr:hypothetical protein [Flavobacteriales bacterium]